MNPNEILKASRSILVIDWPSKEIPESLVHAGFEVNVKGGPGPNDYSVYELSGGKVVPRRTGVAPEKVDLIYSYRPITELLQIVETAKSLHAKTIWLQSGCSASGIEDPKGCWFPEADRIEARTLVEKAGLIFITEPYIADAARELQPTY